MGCPNHGLKLKLGKNYHSNNSIWLAVHPVINLQGNFVSRPLAQYCPTPPSEPNVQGTYDYDPASFNGTVRLNKPGIYSGGKCLGQQGPIV